MRANAHSGPTSDLTVDPPPDLMIEVDITVGLSKKSLSFALSLASSLRKVPSGTRGRRSITVGMYRAYGTVCKDALHQGALV